MHFYTYDEWSANAYYSIDAREIPVGGHVILDLDSLNSDEQPYLNIHSCWRTPVFNSTYSSGTPVILPEISPIDCDIGCLYRFKNGRKGCIQSLNAADADSSGILGSITSYPFIQIVVDKYHDAFNQVDTKLLSVNLDYFSEIDQILIFQSVYSGAISFQEMSSFLEFRFKNSLSSAGNWIADEYKYKIQTNLHSDTSLMMVAALLTFSTSNTSDDININYLTIENLSKFVYGHVDMDQQYDWNLLWKTFVPPSSSKILESSIMHYTKE